jgi:hypothetical protein
MRTTHAKYGVACTNTHSSAANIICSIVSVSHFSATWRNRGELCDQVSPHQGAEPHQNHSRACIGLSRTNLCKESGRILSPLNEFGKTRYGRWGEAGPPGTWVSLYEGLPTCSGSTINADKRMLVFFWDQAHYTRQLARKRWANQPSRLPWWGVGPDFPEAPRACLRRMRTMDIRPSSVTMLVSNLSFVRRCWLLAISIERYTDRVTAIIDLEMSWKCSWMIVLKDLLVECSLFLLSNKIHWFHELSVI